MMMIIIIIVGLFVVVCQNWCTIHVDGVWF